MVQSVRLKALENTAILDDSVNLDLGITMLELQSGLGPGAKVFPAIGFYWEGEVEATIGFDAVREQLRFLDRKERCFDFNLGVDGLTF